MNSAPYLLNEDRPDFEHALDEALRIVLDDEDTAGRAQDRAGYGPLNAEQLRTLALAGAELIGAAAADEYDAYLKVRAESREAVREAARARDGRAFGYAALGVADGAGSGAGLLPVMAVLTPLLAGAAAVIFLLIGYAMRAVTPEPAIGSPLRTAGWFFAAVTAASVLIGAVGLLMTALRDSSSAIHDAPDALPPEVAQARELWQRALLERGLLPFLDDAVARGALAPADPPAAPAPSGPPRIPHLGYSRPDFSSPSPTAQDPRSTPRFSSPDYSSPDFGGPDHAPE